MKKQNALILLVSSVFLLLMVSWVAAFANASGELTHLEGILTIVWGDPIPGSKRETANRYYLTDDAGEIFDLQFEVGTDDLWPLLSLNGQRVQISGELWRDQDRITVQQINLIEGSQPRNNIQVIGSQPWISIMCKFSDVATEPENLAFFQGMYADTYPGLDHYWREQSYGLIDLIGSGAAGWYVLPHPESYYNPSDTQGGTDLYLLADDCIAAADDDVDFTPYAGINMMFNTDFDNGLAWGGFRYMTIDGVYKKWRLTWEPPWGYRNIAVIAHETGHGFGLPHSSGDYGQVYDNYWDVMSNPMGNGLSDPTYGTVGQHTISYHKDSLDWIDAAEKFVPPPDSLTTISLEQLALPQTTNYKMAQIPIGGSSTHFYTVEVRRQVGYDAALPGSAVIIHEVDEFRNEPAHVVDIDDNGDTSDAGAMWTVGETFIDAANTISVTVNTALPTGYVVTIQLGNPVVPPADFDKISPTDGALDQTLNVTLEWQSSSHATSYEYCYDTNDDDVCSAWVSNGTDTSVVLSGLDIATTYYWQVRAKNSVYTTYANGSETDFWSFTTALAPPPANFDKSSPADASTDQPLDVTLEWQSSTAASNYEYCYDTNNDNACSTWISNGANLSATLTSLAEGTTYYWQVRAVNAEGTTYANGSETAFWSFATLINPPEAFSKTLPIDSATDQPTDITLSWGGSTAASSYEYCYDISNDDTCSNWILNGGDISTTLTSLAEDTTYYWQVRALNAGGTTYANGSETAFWSFTTLLSPPEAFSKTLPVDGATEQSTDITLSWEDSAGASSYQYCYDASNDGACNNWISNGSNISTTLTSLAEDTTYYWQVRAVNSSGTMYANGGDTAFWIFTTKSRIYPIFLPMVVR